MSNEETAVPRLVAIDRRQLILRTVDVEKLVEQEHCVRSIWELVGRLDLRLYYAQIAAVEGSAGREHTDPQLLISLWLYAYSRGISSARELNQQAEDEEQVAKRQGAAKRRAARQRASRLEAALREVERLQREKGHARKIFVARASSTDPEAHVMRNGEGGTVPSYNVQLVTDTQHGLVVNVEATTDAIDYRQLDPALARCQQKLGRAPRQIVADGDYTNHASVQAAATHGVDFYGSWQESWKPTAGDAQGRSGAFLSSAFPGAVRDNRLQGQNADGRSAANLRATLAGGRVRACLD